MWAMCAIRGVEVTKNDANPIDPAQRLRDAPRCTARGSVKDLSHFLSRDGGSLGLIREQRRHVDVLPG